MGSSDLVMRDERVLLTLGGERRDRTCPAKWRAPKRPAAPLLSSRNPNLDIRDTGLPNRTSVSIVIRCSSELWTAGIHILAPFGDSNRHCPNQSKADTGVIPQMQLGGHKATSQD
jgi:hypothetical protein